MVPTEQQEAPEPRGWAAIPNWVVREKGLSAAAKLVFVVLSSHIGRSGTWWISHKRIAEESGLSRRTVQRALDDLRDAGLVDWEARVVNNERQENAYHLCIDPMWGRRPGGSRQDGAGGRVRMAQGPRQSGAGKEEPQEEPQEEPTTTPTPSATTPPPSVMPIGPAGSSTANSAGGGGGWAPLDNVTEEFETFYSLYPRRVGKPRALIAYRQARKKVEAQVILAGLRRYAAWLGPKPDLTYVKHPSTWLNQECWADDLPTRRGSPTAIWDELLGEGGPDADA